MSKSLQHEARAAGISRRELLVGYIESMLRASSLSALDFAGRVAVNYVHLVPESSRKIALKLEPDSGEKAIRDTIQSNYQIVHRWITGHTVMPVEAEEALVASLDEPYRSRCIHDLCLRHGVLPVMQSEAGPLVGLGQLLESSGEVLKQAAVVLADGRIDEADRRHAPEAAASLRRMISDATSMLAALEGLLPPAQRSVQVVGEPTHGA